MLASQRRKEATDVKDTAEMVKEALQQASADIKGIQDLLLKLSNTTRRLLKLESDVALLKEKALNTSTSTEKEADSIKALAEKLKKDLDSELKDKYSSVEEVITQKAEGVAEAKKRAEKLQQEAKTLLLQASDKLQLLKNLEKNYDEDQKLLEDKANELVDLEKAVKELLQEISHKVTVYST
ncbi:laminin subunit beta-1-like [Puntigrus tetrazona]|uniref:laminin subunit beta-1-like n=1 Tax=Puntigrus tetrazona TaxID=1606681 RepID=UPI001C891B9E|nr:laminin subunit beta-1-like [Puntigrus tetrazona]